MFLFFAALAIFHQDDLKKRMMRITASWRNGCFGNMNDHLVHTIPNHHPSKMDVLPKPFFQIILAAKCLVRHSSRYLLYLCPPTNSDDHCILFCFNPSSMVIHIWPGSSPLFFLATLSHSSFGRGTWCWRVLLWSESPGTSVTLLLGPGTSTGTGISLILLFCNGH